MKFSITLFSFLLICISFFACTDSNSSKEKEAEKGETIQKLSAKLQFAKSVEDIHKKERFLEEDFVSYQITYKFGNLEDVLTVKAATDLSRVEIASKNFGKSYYNGQSIYMDASANMGDREAKRNFQMVFFYHSFFHISEEAYELYPIEETTFLDQKFKEVKIKNEGFHLAFFPMQATFLVEDRTHMMKGLELSTSLLGNDRDVKEVQLHYDRFITVNHVPVSLNWKFYPKNEVDENSILGEAQVTKIKYYTAEQLQFKIPENANVIKNAPIL
jgi:hypothetical protein